MHIEKMSGVMCFIIITMYFGVFSYAVSTPESDYVYKEDVGAWLRLHRPAIWSDAGMRCLLEGGKLVSPTTNAMTAAMKAMMAEQRLDHVFTGFNAILTERNFTSLEGAPLSSNHLNWAPGQPDNANSDEDCLMLTRTGDLAGVSCESMLPYFCRKENKCGPKDKGYLWEPRTGSCYKLSKDKLYKWRDAVLVCHKEGAHLAIINSQIESTVLKEIMTRERKDQHAYIGFFKYCDGEWVTIEGETLREAGFSGWAEKEPNDVGGDEKCGSVYPSGLLNDASCHKEDLHYICELTP